MSSYEIYHTPNSSVMVLSPMVPTPSPNMVLSSSIRRRRSFTPSLLNVLPTPKISPIKAGAASSKKKQRDQHVRTSARFIFFIGFSTIFLEFILLFFFSIDSSNRLPTSKPTLQLTPATRDECNEQFFSPYRVVNKTFIVAATPKDHNDTFTIGPIEGTHTVLSILKQINMQKYSDLFAEEEIDLLVFLMLTEEEMVEIGIEEDDRPVFIHAINCYSNFFANAE